MFSNPTTLFTQEMLRPELQSTDDYIDGINNIVETQQRIAENYFKDGTINLACPPLKALLHIMAQGKFEGKDANHPEIRKMFTREALFASDWYQQRLETQQIANRRRCEQHLNYLRSIAEDLEPQESDPLNIPDRIAAVKRELDAVNAEGFLASVRGTLGADPDCFGLRDLFGFVR